MKKHLPFLMALFVACSILAAPGTSMALAAGGRPPWAGGDRHHDRDNRDRGEHDRGEHRGHREKWEREHDGRYRFDDNDRRAVYGYFREHRGEFRERWRDDDDYRPPIAYGYVIERPYRRYCRPVPAYLLGELPPPPYGYRYFLIGGNVVLVDDGYRVQDFIHVDVNFGR